MGGAYIYKSSLASAASVSDLEMSLLAMWTQNWTRLLDMTSDLAKAKVKVCVFFRGLLLRKGDRVLTFVEKKVRKHVWLMLYERK